jgi:hypothetical protein
MSWPPAEALATLLQSIAISRVAADPAFNRYRAIWLCNQLHSEAGSKTRLALTNGRSLPANRPFAVTSVKCKVQWRSETLLPAAWIGYAPESGHPARPGRRLKS